MDHDLYRYRARTPLPEKPQTRVGLEGVAAPGDRRAAGSATSFHRGALALRAYVVLFLEHWEAEPPAEQLRDPRFVGEYGSFTPDYRSWTQREYGLRIGFFRVLDALRAAGIRPAVAAHARAAQRVPQLVAALQVSGCEWVAHGLAATQLMHSRMTLQAQRDHIHESLDSLQAVVGTRPKGWLSQDWGTTPHTFELLAEAGVRYTLDWCNDDAPYHLMTEPALTAVPLSAEWDDVQCQWLRQLSPRQHAALTLQAFDRLRQECQEAQRPAVFGLSLHPWVSGMSSRIGVLRRLLDDLRARDDVQWCLPGSLVLESEAPPC